MPEIKNVNEAPFVSRELGKLMNSITGWLEKNTQINVRNIVINSLPDEEGYYFGSIYFTGQPSKEIKVKA